MQWVHPHFFDTLGSYHSILGKNVSQWKKQAWKTIKREPKATILRILKKPQMIYKHYVNAMQLLCNCYANAMRMLYKHYASTMETLCKCLQMLCKDLQTLFATKVVSMTTEQKKISMATEQKKSQWLLNEN